MQLDIMMFFQQFRTPVIEKIAEIISMLGEIAVPLIVLMILLWCVSRKKAFAIASSLMTALIVSQTLKAIFRVPRPFQVYPDKIRGGRLSTATGYSFPSGHSTTSGAFYSALIMTVWKKWATLIFIIPIILVPVSRMILGVHWPLDVTAGTIIGLIAGFGMTYLMLRLYDMRKPFLIFTFIIGLLATIASIVLTILLSTTDIDPVAFEDLMSTVTITGSMFLGFYLERKTVGSIPEEGSIGKKIARFIIGVISTLVIVVLISLIPAPEAFTSFAIYFMIGLWCIYIYPLIAVKTRLMEAVL